MCDIPAPNSWRSVNLYGMAMLVESAPIGYMGALACSAASPLGGALCGIISAVAIWIFDSYKKRGNESFSTFKRLFAYPIAVQTIGHILLASATTTISFKLVIGLASFYTVAWTVAQLINVSSLAFCCSGILIRIQADYKLRSEKPRLPPLLALAPDRKSVS